MPGLFDPDLLDALEEACRGPWEGTVWRAVIGSTEPLRTNLRGGRWNPSGVEVLYCSLSEDGAKAELAAVIGRESIPITKAVKTFSLSVRLSRICYLLDDTPDLEAVGITRDSMISDVWNLPQMIGEAVEWMGVAGLVVPSARHEDGNLVILVNKLDLGDFFEEEQGDLDRN